MKRFFLVSTFIAIALGFTQITWAQTLPCIDNGISGDGFLEVCPDAGGNSETANLDPIGPGTQTNVLFAYGHGVDVGADGFGVPLSDTQVTLQPTEFPGNIVRSSGSFTGQNGAIAWTAVSSIAPASPVYQTVLSFSSSAPLGSLRVIQYLDEDINDEEDDILVVEGTRGASNFRLRTNDGPLNIGLAHAANYLTATNMNFIGWTADKFDDLLTSIEESDRTRYSIPGVVDTGDLPAVVDPRFPGLDIFGPGDVTSAIAFDVDPTATTASVTFTLGGLPQISSADLSISQAARPSPVQGNTTLTYTLTVSNIGPDPATEVTMQNTLPNEVSLNTTPFGCTSDSSSNTVTCAIGTIASNATATPITINVTPPVDCLGTPYSNTSTVSANEVDSTPDNNTALISTDCVLQLQIAPRTESITSGGSINFFVSGGVPPYAFRVVTNNSGGTISSSPNSSTALYTSGLTTTLATDMIEVSDSVGFTAVADVIVNPAPLPIVPNVVGLTEADATVAINVIPGLSAGPVSRANSTTVTAGNVISQDLGPGPVPVGSSVTLTVSSGTGLIVNSQDDAPDAIPGDGVCDIGTGVCTLRAAIQEANAFPGEQTITLTPNTYLLTLDGANEDAAAAGDLDITEDLIITNSTDNTMDVIIAGNALDRVFDLPPGGRPNVTLRNLTIRGGMSIGSTGGGLRNVQGNLVIEDCVVTANQSNGSGGGISHLSGVLTLRGTQVTNNISQGLGGGLQAQEGTVTIEVDTRFADNTANFGGGLSTGRANVTLSNTIVEDNIAIGGGGGIYKFLSPGDLLPMIQAPRVELSNTIIRNNTINDCEGYIINGPNNTFGRRDSCNLLTP